MSSSDSDSDDSLLLAACAFSSNKRKATRTTTTTTRANNRQNAKDTKRSNFLDEMFFQQEERISRRRRMDETIKKEQQEGFIPHENDLIISLADHTGNDDPVDAMGGGAEKELSCQEKERSPESQHNRSTKGNAGVDDNDDNEDDDDDDDDDDDSCASENEEDKMNRTANSRRVNQPHVIVPPPVVPVINYDFDDPAYRARIEAIKEKSRKMTLQPHESRRRMQRQIEGLDVLDDEDDEEEEDEYGRDRGHDKGSPRNMNHPGVSRKYQTEEDVERRMAEIAGAHCTLGMRRTLGWKWIEDHDVKDNKDVNHDMYFIPFESRSDALTELVALFQKYDCEPSKSLKSTTTTTANSKSQDGMKLWMSVRNQVIQPLKKSHGMQILPHMLRRDWKSQLNVPLDIMVWLMRVATTGNNTMFVDLGSGACEMTRKLLERNVNIVQLLDKDGTSNMVVAPSKMFLDMDQFVPMLQLKYGLWMTAKFEKDHDKNASDFSIVTTVGGENNHKRLEEPSGLRHAMMIWTKAIQGGYVQIPQECEKAKICMTYAISAVLFCGMDPIFHNGHG
jgi:hypothetical protein